jgi:hypothetical protein
MSLADLNEDERQRLPRAAESLAGFKQVRERCLLKMGQLDTRREKLERKVIEMDRETERVQRIMRIAKAD